MMKLLCSLGLVVLLAAAYADAQACCVCGQCGGRTSYPGWSSFNNWSTSSRYTKSESWSTSSSGSSSRFGSGGGGGSYCGCSSCCQSFNDIPKDAKIDDAKTACLLFIQQFNEEPLPVSKLNDFVNKKFSAKADEVQKSGVISGGTKEFSPFIFQCCHVKYGKTILGAEAGSGMYDLPALPKGATCDSLTDDMYKALKESQKH